MPKAVADYQPLSAHEIGALLDAAAGAADAFELSKIQCRLARSLPGMTCPRPISGAVAEALAELEEAFVDYADGALDARARVVAALRAV